MTKLSPNLTGHNVAVDLRTDGASLSQGDPVGFYGTVINEGPAGTAATSIAATFSMVPDGLTWYCEDPQGAFPCGEGTELALKVDLAPGEWVKIEAYGSVPKTATDTLSATLHASSGDANPDDDIATATIDLSYLFGSGFE